MHIELLERERNALLRQFFVYLFSYIVIHFPIVGSLSPYADYKVDTAASEFAESYHRIAGTGSGRIQGFRVRIKYFQNNRLNLFYIASILD